MLYQLTNHLFTAHSKYLSIKCEVIFLVNLMGNDIETLRKFSLMVWHLPDCDKDS